MLCKSLFGPIRSTRRRGTVVTFGVAAGLATTLVLLPFAKAAEVDGFGAGKAVAAYSPPPPVAPLDRQRPRQRVEQGASVPIAYVAVGIARMLSAEAGDGEAVGGTATGVDAEDRALLRNFYIQRGFTPAWVDGNGLHGRAAIMFAAFAGAADDGLDPADYLPADLPAGPLTTAGEMARLDVDLSASLLRFARDLRLGRLDPERLDASGQMVRKTFDAATVLSQAVRAGDLGAHLFALIPSNPSYIGLRRSLREYRDRAAAGGWPAPAPERLEPGDEGEDVVRLRTILRATGDLREDPAVVAAPAVYDEAVMLAVKGFQVRHGLLDDGVVGEQTREAMAVPVEERIQQILLNMERVRWLPDDLGDPHVLVNIAGFTLSYVEAGVDTLEMRAIVGKPGRSSPEFSGEISYLELNPSWTVPSTIAREDLMPRIRRDPKFLAANGFSLVNANGGVVDAAGADLGGGSYFLRQKPGPRNALGRVKFMFPNTFDVYLHDTPSRGLFSRPVRALSSGCIRVEKPLDLAAKLLEADGVWTRERLQSAIAGGSTRAVSLSRPVPVHLTYLTAWRDRNGAVHFRDDVYGRDRLLQTALSARVAERTREGAATTATLP